MSAPSHSWKTFELAGKPCDVFEPAKPSGHTVLFLHGRGNRTLVQHPMLSEVIQQHGLRVVCPRGGDSWWLNRIDPAFDLQMTPEHYLLEQVLPTLALRDATEPPRVGLLGIEMGGQAVLRLAFRYPRKFPVAVALLPAIDFHRFYSRDEALRRMFPNAEAARQETALLHVNPLNWPRRLFFAADPADRLWYDGAERLHQKLSAVGIAHECDLRTSTGGDGERYFVQAAPRGLEFLSSALAQQP